MHNVSLRNNTYSHEVKDTQSGYPKLLFIAYELGAWLVRELFAGETALSRWQGLPVNPESLLGRLTGIIFLGADGPGDFQYPKYLTSRFSGPNNANAAVPGFETGNSKPASIVNKIPLGRLGRRLHIIDYNFVEALQRSEHTELASTTWILPAPVLSSAAQVKSPHAF